MYFFQVIELLNAIKKVIDNNQSEVNAKLVESYQQFRQIVEKNLS